MPNLQNKIAKLANKNPGLRKHLVPLLKTARKAPEAYITIDKDAIYFSYSYFLPPIGWVSDMGQHQLFCQKLLERTIDAIQKEFGGKTKKRPTKMHFALDDNKRMVLTGPAPAATGVLGIDIENLLVEDGGDKRPFIKAVQQVFKKLGWDVKSLDHMAI